MKLTIILLTAGFLNVAANGISQTVNYSGKLVTLQEVFTNVERQTGFVFFYDRALIKAASPVSVEAKDQPLKEFLITLLGGKFSYKMKGKHIIVGPAAEQKVEKPSVKMDAVPPIKISGTVVGMNSQPLSGATIRVKGKNITTTSNEKGFFELSTDEGSTLIVSYVGFEEQEFKVRNDEVVRIELVQHDRNMDTAEVVINTGYQKISAERFVGAYSIVDSNAFHRRAGMNIIDRLDGTATGILFNKKDASRTFGIQIRGISTLNSDPNPLIIVDDFPYPNDLSTINPNDVENIVILKDAAAASIWGARAGNGVIVITTKRGKYNNPVKVESRSNLTVRNKNDLYQFPAISSQSFVEIEKFLFEKGFYDQLLNSSENWLAVSPVVEVLDRIEKGSIDPAAGNLEIERMAGFDFRDDLNWFVFKKQISQQHYLNISGGAQLINYNLSVGFNRTGPEIRHSQGANQYTINSNISIKPTQSLEIKSALNISQGFYRSISVPSYRSYPYQRLVNDDGAPAVIANDHRLGYIDTAGGGQLLDWKFRPLDEIRNTDQQAIAKTTVFNLAINMKLNNSLTLNLSAQYSNSETSGRNLFNLKSYYARNLINTYTSLDETALERRNPVPVGSILDLLSSKNVSYNVRGQINYNKNWNNHSLVGILTGEVSETENSGYETRRYGYIDDIGSFNNNVDYVNQFKIYGVNSYQPIPNGEKLYPNVNTRFLSLLSNLSYTYKRKYTLFASGRRDGANVFGVETNNKWKPLWSVGGSWEINKEGFFRLPGISSLKLRVSYGYMGNAKNSVSGLPTIAYSTVPALYSGYLFATTAQPPNPNLRWEQVEFKNVGTDLRILDNVIVLSVDYFRKKSTDLISAVPFAPTSGTSSFPVNAASLAGHGFEVNLTTNLFSKRKVNWMASLGMSYTKMKVTKIHTPYLYKASDFVQFALNPAVGEIAYGLSSYKWAGLDPETGDPRGYYEGKVSSDYVAIINDTLRNQVFHGSSIPLYSGFLTNSISWKGMTVSFNILYKLDYFYRKPTLNYNTMITSGQWTNDYDRRWKRPGDEDITNVPSMIYPIPTDMQQRDEFYSNSEINVSRGDNIRLQDLRFQYLLPQKTIRTVGINLYAYINNINFVIWKKDKSSFDPDFVGGAAFLPTPPKTFTFGINFSF